MIDFDFDQHFGCWRRGVKQNKEQKNKTVF